MIKVSFHHITMDDFLNCFKSDFRYKYHYLGYIYIPFKEGSEPYNITKSFVEWVDEQVKPKFIPRWFLNLLHLYGEDNSIVRVRHWYLYKLKQWICRGVMIYDLKIKWGTMRIYGTFPEHIWRKAEAIERILDNYCEIY